MRILNYSYRISNQSESNGIEFKIKLLGNVFPLWLIGKWFGLQLIHVYLIFFSVIVSCTSCHLTKKTRYFMFKKKEKMKKAKKENQTLHQPCSTNWCMHLKSNTIRIDGECKPHFQLFPIKNTYFNGLTSSATVECERVCIVHTRNTNFVFLRTQI